ncbi:hypothetical protein V1294_003415 [Bradyrhizobium sp. AZCC 1678]
MANPNQHRLCCVRRAFVRYRNGFPPVTAIVAPDTQDGIGRIRIDRCGIYDAASRLHVSYGGLGEIEHRVNIDLESQFPFLVADVIDRLEAGLMRRVVDEDIDAAELRYGFGNDGPAMIRALDVARNQNRLSAGFRHQPFGLPRVVVLLEIGDQDVGSLPGERNGDRAADTAIPSCDDRLLAVEPAAALVRSFDLKSMVSGGELKMALPTELDSSHQSKIDKLKSLKGADFSSRYNINQVSDHKDAISLFERYAKGGDHPKLKEWADKMLPMLRHHLEMAQDLAAGKTIGRH